MLKGTHLFALAIMLLGLSTAASAQRRLEEIPNRRLVRETLNRMTNAASLPGLRQYTDQQVAQELLDRLGDNGDDFDSARATFQCNGQDLNVTFVNGYGEVSSMRLETGFPDNCLAQKDLLNRKLSNVNAPQFFAVCARFDIVRYFTITPEGITQNRWNYVRPYENCLAEAQQITRRG